MNQALVTKHPVTDKTREALAVTLRGCEELIPQEDWLQKLAKSEATGVPLRIKLGLDPTAPDIQATPWCWARCANCRIWGTR